nr:macrophage mannose receptor 1-like [Drosophila bipectinata]
MFLRRDVKLPKMGFEVLMLIGVALTTSLRTYLWTNGPRVCGGKYKAIGSKCYYIENDSEQIWLGALYQCSRLGGHLASIQSQQELNDISKELMYYSEYYIDISDQIEDRKGFLSATTGLAPNFRHPHLEENQEIKGCAVINRLGHMVDAYCYQKKLFVCEKHEEVTQEQKQKIEKNFKKIGHKYYYIENNEQRTWIDAFHKCQELGGHLATSRNDQELINISEELRPGSQYFIDLIDKIEEDHYLSITSGSKDSLFFWADGEPKPRYRRGGAVVIKKSEIGTYMEHVSEFESNYFICEAFF